MDSVINRGTIVVAAGYESDDDEDDDEFDISVQKTCENMKITIVPDITMGAGLNDENFDAQLEPEIESWFEKFQQMWNIYKKSPTTIEALNRLFIESENPLLLALKLFANCPNCNNPKTKSLAIIIIQEIAEHKNKYPSVIEKCSDNMRMVAFNFVKNHAHSNLYLAVANAYDLLSVNYLFEGKLRELIERHYYKEAAQLTLILGLTHRFNEYDIVFPLILQDKISFAEDYLTQAKHLQRTTIELLDSLLDNRSQSVFNNCDKYIAEYHYTDVRMEKLYAKPLSKLIARLVRKYNIPNECTPFMNRSKNFAYLQYLVHKKYVERSLNQDSWAEMVKDTVKHDCRDLQLELINSISYNNDLNEAVFWTKYYKIPISELPILVQKHLTTNLNSSSMSDTYGNSCPKDSRETCAGFSGKDKKFHTLELDECNVILISTRKRFNMMMKKLKNQRMIAFDSEWKPSFNANNDVSLIQIACQDKIFLIDVLSKELDEECWMILGKCVFNNGEMLKIGFSLCHDLQMFQKALPALNISVQVQTSYLDLQDAWRKLCNIAEFSFPFTCSTSGETLSCLVELCLGRKLDKSNQFSNWSNRPLRREQIIYAALDAYCLLEIYDVISSNLARIDIDIGDFVDTVISEVNSKAQRSKKKTRPTHQQQQQQQQQTQSFPKMNALPSPHVVPVRVSDIKFVCDNMLEGLAKSLRKYGLDCISISSKDDLDKCVRIAMREKRFLLTKGSHFDHYSQYFPIGHSYKIDGNALEEQLIEVIKYFNVIIKKEDIFSRCQVCNSKEFLLATSADLKFIKYGEDQYYEENMQKVFCAPPQKSCDLKIITPEIRQSGVTNKGVKIQISIVSSSVLESVNQFYICDGCGKCYWDGSHLEKVLRGKLKNIAI